MLKAQVKESQAYGNAEVIEFLEGWLDLARKGQISHVSLVAHQLPNLMACSFAGIADLEYAAPYALDQLKLKMWETARRNSGPPPKDLDAAHVCYNLGSSPTSYDFLVWLIAAEMTRIKEGAAGPLKIAFTHGQDGKSGLNTGYRRQMYTGVMRPLLPMIGAIETDAAVGGRDNRWFVMKPVTDMARAGIAVPKLTPPEQAKEFIRRLLHGGPQPITITLRELDTWKHRNSNLDNWFKLADDLDRQGERVIFLRDTAKAGEPLLGRETCPIASTNIHVRQALYEEAKLNFFVPNGPWNLALFGTKPWILFNEVSDDDPFICNRPEFWRDSQGIEIGEQFPWQTKDQKIIWKRDDYDVIRAAWDER
jgi:hypothetical protein